MLGRCTSTAAAWSRLDLDRLRALAALPWRSSSTALPRSRPGDLQAAIGIGVRKINVGSRLKQTFLGALREACRAVSEGANPYEAIGSGIDGDVLLAGLARNAVRSSG